ncbi:MAG: hypothetical protein IIC54_12175 [Proteobacteria bacterium]|nr:hypothetical protein [Pseudomonadota bacterium]
MRPSKRNTWSICTAGRSFQPFKLVSFSAVSWYASLIPAGLTYYLLMKHWAPCQRFRQ